MDDTYICGLYCSSTMQIPLRRFHPCPVVGELAGRLSFHSGGEAQWIVRMMFRLEDFGESALSCFIVE